MDYAKNLLYNLIKDLFNSIYGVILTANDLILKTPEEFNSQAYGMVKTIANSIIPIALVIAVMFWIIEFCKKSMMFEVTTPESIAKLVFKFIFCKVFIQASFELCVTIYSGVFGILSKVVGISQVEGGQIMSQLDTSLQVIKTEIDGLGLIGLVALLPFLALFCILMFIVNWVITLIIYGRFIELFMLFALCPLPLATLTSDMTHDIAKRFLQEFIAVSLQAVVMVIVLAIYTVLIMGTDFSTGTGILGIMGGYILGFLVLVLTLFKSGSWAKKFVGLG